MMALESFFSVQRAEIQVRPRNPAYAMLFWYVTGHNPHNIICGVRGSAVHFCKAGGYWAIGSCSFSREGNYR